MRNYNRITPEGTKDLLLEECLVRRETEEKIRSVFQSQGYDELVTPGLEFFDVFQSEAVQYPQEQLYKLTDSKGRLIVLRPESTAPIARVVATRLREAMLPQRLCYMQTAYRFEPALKGRSDEFMQAGAELIGSDSYMADLEMASMAETLQRNQLLSGIGRCWHFQGIDAGIERCTGNQRRNSVSDRNKKLFCIE